MFEYIFYSCLVLSTLCALYCIAVTIVWKCHIRYHEKMRLKHPDYAIAVKQLAYARHRFESHRSCVLVPLMDNIKQLESTPISWDYQRNDLRKQAIQHYRKDLDFETEVSEILLEDYKSKRRKVVELAKKYKIKLDKGFNV